MALAKGVSSTSPDIKDEQRNDTADLVICLSKMSVDARYVIKLMVKAYSDGLSHGYELSGPQKNAG